MYQVPQANQNLHFWFHLRMDGCHEPCDRFQSTGMFWGGHTPLPSFVCLALSVLVRHQDAVKTCTRVTEEEMKTNFHEQI